jgi:hypothetical protein
LRKNATKHRLHPSTHADAWCSPSTTNARRRLRCCEGGIGGNTSAGQDPGEIESSASLQYGHTRYEAGLQGAFGQDFGDSKNHDGEIHAYALYRVIPQLGFGAAGQVRMAIGPTTMIRTPLLRTRTSSAAGLEA